MEALEMWTLTNRLDEWRSADDEWQSALTNNKEETEQNWLGHTPVRLVAKNGHWMKWRRDKRKTKADDAEFDDDRRYRKLKEETQQQEEWRSRTL